jgi:hypothetical protein
MPSPDGQHKAVIFTRSCGATTDFVTEVSILRGNEGIPRGTGNAFVVAYDPEHSATRKTDAVEIRIQWKSDQLLSIAFPKMVNVVKRADRVEDMEIEYRTF